MTNNNSFINSDTLSNSLPSLNPFSWIFPGIYQIRCKVNNKKYIGEAVNILDRLAKHSRQLLNGSSDCSSLQLDWNLYGAHQFEASVLFCGKEWEEKGKRLEKEKEIICSYNPNEVYNEHPNKPRVKEYNYRVVCEIEGERYESIGEASRVTGERESRIRAKLYANYEGYVIIDKVKHGYEPIIANGKLYDSIVDAVIAGEAKDRFQAMRFLKSQKYKDWNYVSPEKSIDKSNKKGKD